MRARAVTYASGPRRNSITTFHAYPWAKRNASAQAPANSASNRLHTEIFFVLGHACELHVEVSMPLGREFTLRPGESVTIQSTDLRVSFQGVVEDSRCPADATCVWAGDAVVALEVGTASLELRSTTAPEGVVGAYRVRLERVEPNVYRDRKIPPEAYRVVLTVTRS